MNNPVKLYVPIDYDIRKPENDDQDGLILIDVKEWRDLPESIDGKKPKRRRRVVSNTSRLVIVLWGNTAEYDNFLEDIKTAQKEAEKDEDGLTEMEILQQITGFEGAFHAIEVEPHRFQLQNGEWSNIATVYREFIWGDRFSPVAADRQLLASFKRQLNNNRFELAEVEQNGSTNMPDNSNKFKNNNRNNSNARGKR